MPIKSASKKDLKNSQARFLKNILLRKQLGWFYQQANSNLKKGDINEAKKIAAQFQKISDKLAKNNIITKQFANRRKSKLMRAITLQKTS